MLLPCCSYLVDDPTAEQRWVRLSSLMEVQSNARSTPKPKVVVHRQLFAALSQTKILGLINGDTPSVDSKYVCSNQNQELRLQI